MRGWGERERNRQQESKKQLPRAASYARAIKIQMCPSIVSSHFRDWMTSRKKIYINLMPVSALYIDSLISNQCIKHSDMNVCKTKKQIWHEQNTRRHDLRMAYFGPRLYITNEVCGQSPSSRIGFHQSS